MAVLKSTETTEVETETEVTPDFCFQKAAEVLVGVNTNAQYVQQMQQQGYMTVSASGTPVEVAREWRALGEALLGAQHFAA